MRLMLGLDPQRRAPALGYPERVRQVTVEPTSDRSELRLRITHPLDSPAGYMLLVRMTPEAVGGGKPRALQARCILGLGPQSATALPESGGLVTFHGITNRISPGRYFGVDLTIIRAEDGLASASAFFCLTMPNGG